MSPPTLCFALPGALNPLRFALHPHPAVTRRAVRCAHQSFDRGAIPGGADPSTPAAADPTLPATLGVATSPGSPGGGGGGGAGGPDRPWGGGEGNGEDGFIGLRAEVAAALQAGRVTSGDVRRLLALEAGRLRGVCALFPGLRDRLAANPLFFTQLCVELLVGVVTKTAAEVAARGARLADEAALVASDLALEVATDASLVWLLSPRLRLAAPRPGGWLSALPSHASQVGSFTPAQRAATFAVRGGQFAAVAFVSAVIGHSVTRAFVARREHRKAAAAGESATDEALGPVLPTATAWSGFVMTSSNARYQLVNGIEERFVGPLLSHSPVLRTAVTFGLRFSNCMAGSWQWIPWAKFWGAQ